MAVSNRLQDKVAVITGGSQGLGRGIAKRLAAEGAKVLVNGLSEQGIHETVEEIRREGGTAVAARADVTRGTEVEATLRKAVAEFGSIDILVNNAGKIVIKPFLEQSEEDWDTVFNVNVRGIFLCCKAVLPLMIKQGNGGKIINISSQAGKEGSPFMVPYCASKHAVIGLTRALALEVARYKINVNAVCPGTIVNTKMRGYVDSKLEKLGVGDVLTLPPLGKFALPEDVAPLVAFLASSDSDHMTGQAINVTGGQTQA